jgi:heme/copper-type cytochrome/quinol oxidase subunit 2
MQEYDVSQSAAVDGMIFAMLGMMILSMSVIGLLIFCMRRNAARRDPHVDELLEEVAETERIGKQTPALSDGPAPEPWERAGDWWKEQ